MNRMREKKAFCEVFLIAATVMLAGCGIAYTGNPHADSAACANAVMGNGRFAFAAGFVYYTDSADIYEYDTESKKTVFFSGKKDYIANLYAQDEYIYFAYDGLYRITKDGKKLQKIFEREDGCVRLFVEEAYAWYLDSVEGTLYRRDLQTGKEEAALSNVMAYCVDGNRVFGIVKEKDASVLYISEKETLDFQEEPLSFSPIAVTASEGDLFLAERGTWQVVRYSGKKETPLPVYSTHYQVLGNSIFYRDERPKGLTEEEDGVQPEPGNGAPEAGGLTESREGALMQYDMTTGDVDMICEDTADFSILDGRYVGIQTYDDGQFQLYDLETKETETVFYGGEKGDG